MPVNTLSRIGLFDYYRGRVRYGIIDDLTLTYSGNRLLTVSDLRYGSFSQDAYYFVSGANPSFTGRISQKTATAGATDDTYIYSYDMLGRLTSATFHRVEPDGLLGQQVLSLANYSTSYTYDLQGNLLTLKRQGPVTPKTYGMVDNITATYSGNQIASLRDDAPSVLLESSLDMASGSWSGSDFAYDRNGNQTRDMSRGVADIDYNALNLPRRIEMASGGTIECLYSAAGTKLAEIVRDSDGTQTKRRDYAGIFEFENGEMKNISLASGYITPADTTYHIYVPDHQGNIVAVYNTRSGLQEQYSSFYPYGLPQAQISSSSSLLHPLSSGVDGQNSTLSLSPGSGIIISPNPTLPDFTSTPCTNRRLYSAKELTTDHGLNTYDFEARVMAPAFPRFTTVDPKADKYFPISPFSYCGNDPINITDKSGEEWDYEETDDGRIIIKLFVNVTYDCEEAKSLSEEILQCLAETFNSMIEEASNGICSGQISFAEGDETLTQTITFTEYDSSNTAGMSYLFASLVNIRSITGSLNSLKQISSDAIHELLHTLKLNHPFEETQTQDTELIQVGRNQYLSYPHTDRKIYSNVMNYGGLFIDGILTTAGSDLTPGQLQFMLKEIKLQNTLFSKYRIKNQQIPDAVLKEYFKN